MSQIMKGLKLTFNNLLIYFSRSHIFIREVWFTKLIHGPVLEVISEVRIMVFFFSFSFFNNKIIKKMIITDVGILQFAVCFFYFILDSACPFYTKHPVVCLNSVQLEAVGVWG